MPSKSFANKINYAEANEGDKLALKREIELQRTLTHPNIVPLLGSFEQDGKLYIFLERLDTNLFQFMQRRNFDERTALKIYYKVCKAVKFLHSKNLIHRDIKPENVLLSKTGKIKLCDFGFCAPFGDDDKRNTMCGTKEYLPPEIIESKEQDDKADVWCLGVMLYELIHKKIPFDIKNFKIMLEDVRRKKFHIKEGLSEGTRAILMKSLEADPRNRPSVREILKMKVFDSFRKPKKTPHILSNGRLTKELEKSPEFAKVKDEDLGNSRNHVRKASPSSPSPTTMRPVSATKLAGSLFELPDSHHSKKLVPISQKDHLILSKNQSSNQEEAYHKQNQNRCLRQQQKKRPISQNVAPVQRDQQFYAEHLQKTLLEPEPTRPKATNGIDQKVSEATAKMLYSLSNAKSGKGRTTDDDPSFVRPVLYHNQRQEKITNSNQNRSTNERFKEVSPTRTTTPNKRPLTPVHQLEAFGNDEKRTQPRLYAPLTSQTEINMSASMQFGKAKIPINHSSSRNNIPRPYNPKDSSQMNNSSMVNLSNVNHSQTFQHMGQTVRFESNYYQDPSNRSFNNLNQPQMAMQHQRMEGSPMRVMFGRSDSNTNAQYISNNSGVYQYTNSPYALNRSPSPLRIVKHHGQTAELVTQSYQFPSNDRSRSPMTGNGSSNGLGPVIIDQPMRPNTPTYRMQSNLMTQSSTFSQFPNANVSGRSPGKIPTMQENHTYGSQISQGKGSTLGNRSLTPDRI